VTVATVVEIKPRLPERVCRECSPAHAVRCDDCARWVCLHWAVRVAGVLGRPGSTVCRWCQSLSPWERAALIAQ
jgi:hypothetical protein